MISPRMFAWVSALLLVPDVGTPALLAQGPQGPQPRVFLLALDTDHDGQLSAAEIAAASTSLLNALDKNHDGQITSDEYSPHIAAASATAPSGSNELFLRMMSMDKNQDGVLTKDEVPERMQAMFDRANATPDTVSRAGGSAGASSGAEQCPGESAHRSDSGCD